MKQKNFLKIIFLLFFSLIFNTTYSQNSNGTIDVAGDIAIIAFNKIASPSQSDYAFVLLDECTNGTSIIFDDDEWNGTAWASATGEGANTWTNDTGRTLGVGTVVQITFANNTTPSASIGSATESNAGFNLSSTDQLYAYIGTFRTAGVTFITAYGNLTDTGITLTGTGLTDGSTANDTSNLGFYSGSTICSGTVSACGTTINTIGNWTTGTFTFPTGVATSFNGSALPTNWNGTTNSTWTEKSNWSNNDTQNSGSVITIPNGLTNYPTTGATAITINTATINSGATLDTQSATSFTGTVTYNRALATTNWYLVSSPVSGEIMTDMRANNSFITNGSSKISFAPYDNSQVIANNRWAYFANTATDALANGKGYSTSLTATGNISFSGTINTSDVTLPISIGGGNAFNLVGNPFTAYINSGTGGFLSDNTARLTTQTLWVWDQGTNAYITKVVADEFKIAPGQGFFVECGSAGNVTFQEADQSHEAVDTFMRTTNSRPEIHVFMTDGTTSKFTKIYYINGTTTGFDNGYDGELFGGVANPFAVYTHLVSDSQGKDYQIQSLPDSNYENMIIPIGVNATAGTEITFTADIANLPAGLDVYIENRTANTFTKLSDNGNYTITLNANSNGIGQFYLRTSASTLSVDNVILENVSIYKTSNTSLRIVGLQQGKASVKIVNLLGKEMIHKSFPTNGVSDISLPKLAAGIYIVQLQTEKGKLNKKIIIE